MDAAIISIGTANPQYKHCQKKAAEFVAATLNLNPTEKKLLKTLYRFTGINYRYSVLNDPSMLPGDLEFFPNSPEESFPTTTARMQVYKQHALALALAAVADALNSMQDFSLQEITHVVTVSCTGMYAPGLDIELVQALNLPHSTQRTAVNFMGCYAAFNGIKLAESICRSNASATVLVVCVEICSIHLQNKIDLDNLTSNAIFADGAGCVIIQKPGSQKKSLTLKQFHCDLLPQSSQEMAWSVGDFGFEMVLTTYVTQAISEGIPYFLTRLIEKGGLSQEDIHYYAIHPGAHKILKACEKALNISKEHNRYSYEVLRDYGNMSSATILFVLKKIWLDINSSADHERNIFSCAFGPGLTLESMLLQVNYV